TPRTAGYDYGAKRGIAPTGLAPASTTVSLAALPPVGPIQRWPDRRVGGAALRTTWSDGALARSRPARSRRPIAPRCAVEPGPDRAHGRLPVEPPEWARGHLWRARRSWRAAAR